MADEYRFNWTQALRQTLYFTLENVERETALVAKETPTEVQELVAPLKAFTHHRPIQDMKIQKSHAQTFLKEKTTPFPGSGADVWTCFWTGNLKRERSRVKPLRSRPSSSWFKLREPRDVISWRSENEGLQTPDSWLGFGENTDVKGVLGFKVWTQLISPCGSSPHLHFTEPLRGNSFQLSLCFTS